MGTLLFRDGHSGFSLTLKRDCSISPKALAGVFVALALVVLVIGAGFAAAGAWLVLPFADAEALALGVAFLVHARRAPGGANTASERYFRFYNARRPRQGLGDLTPDEVYFGKTEMRRIAYEILSNQPGPPL